MCEENRLQHFEIFGCTSKEQEILNSTQKHDKHVSVDSSGAVRICDKDSKLEADLSTDMLTRRAFTRRGLARTRPTYSIIWSMTSGSKNFLTTKLQPNPKVTLQQVINADRRLFAELAELTS